MTWKEIEPDRQTPSLTTGSEAQWLKELKLTRSSPAMEDALVMAQGIVGDSPERRKIIEMIEREDEARQNYKDGDYKGAEEKAKVVLTFLRSKLSKDAALALYPAQKLLARSMSKQGKDASAEFDEAIRLGKLGPVERSKAEIAELYLGKSNNSLDRKDKPADPKEAFKAAAEGIDLLKGTKVEAERRVLADLYSTRAAAKLALKDTKGAEEDLQLARSLQK
jgi:hypothetical protein